eukprot:6482990-Amphidinium_carterae.1
MSNNESEVEPRAVPLDAEDFDDADGYMALSSRLVLGTQAAVPRRSVPTITSPAASRPGTSSGSRPGTSAGRVTNAVPTIVARVQADVPVQTVANYCGVPLRGIPASGDQIATGPPAQAQNVQSVARPGSRGGTGMPSPQLVSKRPVHSSGYASLHSRAKATGAASSPASESMAGRATPQGVDACAARTGAPGPKPASKPRCGPEIFNMLRKKESPAAVAAESLAEVDVAPETVLQSESVFIQDDVHFVDHRGSSLAEERGFVMPADSDDSGLEIQHSRLQEVLPEAHSRLQEAFPATPSKVAAPAAAS